MVSLEHEYEQGKMYTFGVLSQRVLGHCYCLPVCYSVTDFSATWRMSGSSLSTVTQRAPWTKDGASPGTAHLIHSRGGSGGAQRPECTLLMPLASESLLPALDIYTIRSRRDSLCRVRQCQPGEWMGRNCGTCILGRTRRSRLNLATDRIILRNPSLCSVFPSISRIHLPPASGNSFLH